MEADSVLVTGANRGIGLELVKQLVNLPKPPRLVFATYRNRDTVQALQDIRDSSTISQVILIKMDVTRAEDIEHLRKMVEDRVGEKGLTMLINNAGASMHQSFPEITDENLLFHLSTNTLGPINVLKAMLPLLKKSADANPGAKIGFSRAGALNISSMGGSISFLTADNFKEQYKSSFGYRISKAALNMAMRLVAFQTKDQGVLMVQMCPGWVKTDMGTEAAKLGVDESVSAVLNTEGVLLEVDESVSAILNTLLTLNESHHGEFVSHKGERYQF